MAEIVLERGFAAIVGDFAVAMRGSLSRSNVSYCKDGLPKHEGSADGRTENRRVYGDGEFV